MGTPNSSEMDFRTFNLVMSENREDFAVALKALEVVQKIVTDLKPILRYVTVTIACLPGTKEACRDPKAEDATLTRALGIGVSHPENVSLQLFLSEDGRFFLGERCPNDRTPRYAPHNFPHYHLVEPTAMGSPEWCDGALLSWELYPFSAFFDHLQACLQRAKERREKHVASIAKRTAKLDEVLAILRRPE